jgi:hypothetical protein
MKMSAWVLVPLVVLSSAISGGEGTPEDSPSAHLLLCYATSIAMPESENGPENAFDDDPETAWVTMPGAAHDEGLFLSFEEAILIDAIRLHCLPGSDGIEGIEYCQLYVNGVETPIFLWDRETVPLNLPVKSLFIRISSTESTSGEYPLDGIRYAGDLPVGISEVVLLVDDGEGDEVPLRVNGIGKVSGGVQASSSLAPVEAYGPDFLFDSRTDFGWADGNPARTGEGESLTFTFDEPQRIERIRIWNGYQRSAAHFDQNERAALVSFGETGGEASEYRLADSMEPQEIVLDSPLEGRTFTLTFEEVYGGRTYRDLVISEMSFFDGGRWFVLDSGEGEARKRAILEWAAGTEAGAFIDRQIFLGTGEREESSQTLVIRSSGSFILWKHNDGEDGIQTTYADGNWQILDDRRLRIFGRLHRMARYLEEGYDPYSGVQPDEAWDLDRITIFSDTLRIDAGRISSSRGLFEDFVY